MATRIKVTAYINPDALDPEMIDLADDTGLSSDGFVTVGNDLADAGLEDIEFEVED